LKITDREVDGVSVVALGRPHRARRGKQYPTWEIEESDRRSNGENRPEHGPNNLYRQRGARHSGRRALQRETQGASLLLCHFGSKFKEVLQITKLLTVFEVCDTEAAAAASFSRWAQFAWVRRCHTWFKIAEIVTRMLNVGTLVHDMWRPEVSNVDVREDNNLS
jgi:hypothetical protein